MSTTYFTSDLHLGHKNIVSYCNRPFNSVEEMDKAILSRWQKTVTRDDDIVWVLGDISIDGSFKHALDLMRTLRGRKRLIMGNHDRCFIGHSEWTRHMKYYQVVFELVLPSAVTKVGGTKVLLSHFPYSGDSRGEDRYDQYRLPDLGMPLLHGHTHSTEVKSQHPRQIHVGVDSWDFRPVASHVLEDLLQEG